MDRETCKANLKKLRLPGIKPTAAECSGGSLRKTQPVNGSISRYFNAPTNNTTTNAAEYKKEERMELEKTAKNKTTPTSSSLITNEIDMGEQKKRKHASSCESLESHKSTDMQVLPITTTTRNRKRTKLKDFVSKEYNTGKGGEIITTASVAESSTKNCRNTPLPNVQKKGVTKQRRVGSVVASKVSKSKAKIKQPDIKSSLLRSERLFSELTAQHCRVDNFSADEIELALALSKSESDVSYVKNDDVEMLQQPVQEPENSAKNDLNDIQHILKQYGFRTLPEAYSNLSPALLAFTNRRAKSKWANRFTALTLRDPCLQSKRLTAKINTLINMPLRTKNKLPANETKNHLPITYYLISCKLNNIKRKSCLRSLASDETIDLQSFYVKDLFEASHAPIGYLLKDWNAIPGRERSPKRNTLIENEELQTAKEIDSVSSFDINTAGTLTNSELTQQKGMFEIDNNKRSAIDDDQTKELDKNRNAPLTVCNLQEESIFDIEGDLEQCATNVLLHVDGTEDVNKIVAPHVHQSADKSKFEEIANGKYELASNELAQLHACEAAQLNSGTSMTRTCTQSPNIFASSSDEDEPAKTFSTIANSAIGNQPVTIERDLFSAITTKPITSDFDNHTQNHLTSEASNDSNAAKSLCMNIESLESNDPPCNNIQQKDLPLTANTTNMDTDIDEMQCYSALNTNSTDEHDDDEDSVICLEDSLSPQINVNRAFDQHLSENEHLIDTTPPPPPKQMHSNYFEPNKNVFGSPTANENKHKKYSQTLSKTQTKQEVKRSSTLNRSKSAPFTYTPTKKGTQPFAMNATPHDDAADSENSEIDDWLILSDEENNYSIRKADGFETKNTGQIQSESEPFSMLSIIERTSSLEEIVNLNKSSHSADSYVFTCEDEELAEQAHDDYDDIPHTSKCNRALLRHRSTTTSSNQTTVKPLDFDKLLTSDLKFSKPNAKEDETVPMYLHSQRSKLLPAHHEYEIHGRTYITRSVTEPKPNFKQQTEAEILKQLYGFGIKPLKRKQAIKMLEYIYNSTHPLIRSNNNNNDCIVLSEAEKCDDVVVDDHLHHKQNNVADRLCISSEY